MRARTSAVVVAACATLTACGGGHTATKQDVIAQGNAICAGALRDIRALPSPATGGASTAGLAKYLGQVVPIIHKEIADLRGLPRPARDRALLDRYLTAVAGTESEYRALAAAARSGNSPAVSATLATLANSPAATLAARYGLTQCASATGTAVS